MERLWTLLLVLIPALLSFYNARGGGLERRLIATAKADLELAEKLEPGLVRNALVQHADFTARRVLLLRQTGSMRRTMLGLTIGGYVFVALGLGAMWEPLLPGETQDTDHLIALFGGLAVALIAGARYMVLRTQTPGEMVAQPAQPAPTERTEE